MALNASLEMSLLDACAEGDAGAWRELHRHYYPVAASFLRKLGVGADELDDALQDVFLRVYRYLPQFRRGARLSTWLYRVCITEARRARNRARMRRLLRGFLTVAGATEAVDGLSEDAALGTLHRALATLRDTERAAFVLYEMEGLSGKEIAETLGWPEASVWPRLHYARKIVRQALGSANFAEGS